MDGWWVTSRLIFWMIFRKTCFFHFLSHILILGTYLFFFIVFILFCNYLYSYNFGGVDVRVLNNPPTFRKPPVTTIFGTFHDNASNSMSPDYLPPIGTFCY